MLRIWCINKSLGITEGELLGGDEFWAKCWRCKSLRVCRDDVEDVRAYEVCRDKASLQESKLTFIGMNESCTGPSGAYELR